MPPSVWKSARFTAPASSRSSSTRCAPASRTTTRKRPRRAQSAQPTFSSRRRGLPPSAGHQASVPETMVRGREVPSSTSTSAPSSEYAIGSWGSASRLRSGPEASGRVR
jgi:hypothetical protein